MDFHLANKLRSVDCAPTKPLSIDLCTNLVHRSVDRSKLIRQAEIHGTCIGCKMDFRLATKLRSVYCAPTKPLCVDLCTNYISLYRSVY